MTTSNDSPEGKYYVNEKPCIRGHYLRFKASRTCVECDRQRDRDRYAAKVAAQGRSLRAQAPKGSRKDTPAEALSEPVERISLTPEQANHHLRQVALSANPGPVQDAFLSVLQDTSDRLNQCRNLPPLPAALAQKPIPASWR
jgi:hypothetical protein